MNTQSENFEGQIRAKLSRLSPAVIELDNETIHHKGHVGAASGGGHYRLSSESSPHQNPRCGL